MNSEMQRRFVLGAHLTQEQRDFFDRHGFLHFEGFANPAEVEELRAGMREAEERLLAQRPVYVNGIPIRYGRDVDGRPIVQRIAFTSLSSRAFERFVRPERFGPVLELL